MTEKLDYDAYINHAVPAEDTGWAKLQREGQLLLSGASGFGQAAGDSLTDYRTAVKVAVGVGTGLAIARFAPCEGLAGAFAKSAATTGVLAFGADILWHAGELGGAAVDTWNSPLQAEQSQRTFAKHGGQFLFDTSLMTATGMLTARMMSPRWLPEERDLSTSIANRANQFKPGETITDWVKVNGEYRQFVLQIPKNYEAGKPAPLVVALDGLLVASKNPARGMAEVNGVGEQSDKLGFISLYVMPKKRFGGLLSTWNEPDGAVNLLGVRGHSDTEYVQKSMAKVMSNVNIDRSQVFGVGFSQGALQLHEVVGRSAPGTFSAVASVHGTLLSNVKPAQPGTRLLVIHSEGDKTLPYKGGTGGLTAWLESFGWTRARDSKPFAQVEHYLKANGIAGVGQVAHAPEYRSTTWRPADVPAATAPLVQEILLSSKFGHSFPGRPVGGVNESNTSRFNGQVADASVLDAKKLIFEDFFALRLRQPVAGK